MLKPRRTLHLATLFTLGALALGSLSACAPKRAKLPYIEVPPGAGKAEAAALIEEGNAAFRNRHERAQLELAKDKFEQALAIDPRHPGVGGQLAWIYFILGEYYTDKDDTETRKNYYHVGREYALKGLEANPKMREILENDGDIRDALPFATIDDVPALYWGAIDWGRWGQLVGLIRMGLDIPKIKAMNDRVMELDESYLEYSVHRFYGVYYVEIPVGKDPEKSREHFEIAIAKSKALTTKVLMAEYYATFMDDRELYVRLLNEVVAAKLDPNDPLRLDDEHAQQYARELLDEVDDIF
ncbi:MAG: hypothetical protein KDH09_13865 [Chrysiogenetes bacterium]|nr:hypothetical protein [Chrysiogenetes bacterium]